MFFLKITNIVLTVVLVVLGAETIIKIRKSEDREIEEIRKPLILRLNIIITLTVIISIIGIITVILR